MNISPVGTKLLVKPLPRKEEMLDSGIIVPGSANANLLEAEVVSVSSQISHLYKVGDVVLYPEKKGVGQILNNQAYLWLDADDNLKEIWGIVDNKTNPVDNGDSL